MAKYATMLVEGNSMLPTYSDGDWLMGRWTDYTVPSTLIATIFSFLRGNRVRVGKVVVIERDEQPGVFYIKRVSEIRATRGEVPSIFLLSDNPEGTDSRTWGWLPVTSVRARIEFRARKGR